MGLRCRTSSVVVCLSCHCFKKKNVVRYEVRGIHTAVVMVAPGWPVNLSALATKSARVQTHSLTVAVIKYPSYYWRCCSSAGRTGSRVVNQNSPSMRRIMSEWKQVQAEGLEMGQGPWSVRGNSSETFRLKVFTRTQTRVSFSESSTRTLPLRPRNDYSYYSNFLRNINIKSCSSSYQ